VFYVVIASLLLAGCGTSAPFARRDVTSIDRLTVVRKTTPPIRGSATGSAVFFSVVTGGPLLGGVIAKAFEKGVTVEIPDFGDSVLNNFKNIIETETNGWPTLELIDKPVLDSYTNNGFVLEFSFQYVGYGFGGALVGGSGVRCVTTMTMKDLKGEEVWSETYEFRPGDHNRNRKNEELEANDYSLLREDLLFAGSQTALTLHKYFILKNNSR
jgi:hypothetical protein